MNGKNPGTILVSPAPPVRYKPALRLIFSRQKPSTHHSTWKATLESVRQGKISLEGLFIATRNDKLVGAIWANVLPGKIAMVWPPQLSSEESTATIKLLWIEVNKYLKQQNMDLAQSLLATRECFEANCLLEDGYFHAADLLTLVSQVEDFPQMPPPTDLNFLCFDERDTARLQEIVLQTYQKTMDCPQLNDAREISDVLAGYREMGDSRAKNWFIIQQDGKDLGCLLLADHAAGNLVELVYMGLIPPARGKGLGLVISRQAQWHARCMGRKQVALAVDAANDPAIQMYASAGFIEIGRQSAFLKKAPFGS